MTKLTKIFLFLLLITACNEAPVLSPKQADQLDTVDVTNNLRIELDITSEQINGLQDLKADFILKNISGKTISYSFPSGCQYGFTIERNQEVIFDSRKNTACTAVLTKLKLNPEETKTYPISLESYNVSDRFKKGTYKLTAFLLEDHGVSISTKFVVD